MAEVKILSRVAETSSTTGSGVTIDLNGAVALDSDGNPVTFFAFGDQLADGGRTYYAIEDGSGFEEGLGTFHAGATATFDRDTVYRSSAGGSRINLSGNAIVFATLPGDKAVHLDDDGKIAAPTTFAAPAVFESGVETRGDVSVGEFSDPKLVFRGGDGTPFFHAGSIN